MASQFGINEGLLVEMSSVLTSRVVGEVMAQVQGMLQQTSSVTLNIAVTGESGSGKSSFINAFRGVSDDEPEAAETGVTETTMDIRSYPHPTAHNVLLWDLPGIGTLAFQPQTYLEDVNLLNYDFFVIVSSGRFQECHLALAKHIMKAQKKFYFIRNKVDQDLDASNRRRKQSDLSDDDVLNQLRLDCENNLKMAQVEQAPVFLISCFHPQKFDFSALQMTLLQELDGHKRHALLLSLPNLSKNIIQNKKEVLSKTLWKTAMVASLSSVGSGATFHAIVPKLMETLTTYQQAFCIDSQSLKRLAGTTGISFEELRREITSSYGRELTAQTLEHILSQAASGQNLLATQLENRIPILGSVFAGGISFVASYYLLSTALNELSEDGERVMQKAILNSFT